MNTKEVVLYLSTEMGDNFYLFPDRRWSSTVSAESRLIGARTMKGQPFLIVHPSADRNSTIINLSANHVTSYVKQVVDMPLAIKTLITNLPKEEEEPALYKQTVAQIQAYLEQL